MKPSEHDAFEKRYGYKPTAIPVAIDAIAIFVHKDNPLTGLTLEQVDGIFSSMRKRGGKLIQTWGLGADGRARAPVSMAATVPRAATGSSRRRAAEWRFSGDGEGTARLIVRGARVAHDLGGMGYAGIGYQTPGSRRWRWPRRAGRPSPHRELPERYVSPGALLYIYVHKKPAEPIEKLVHEFQVRQRQRGQTIVKDDIIPARIGRR